MSEAIQMKPPIKTDTTADGTSIDALREVIERHDAKAIATALHIPVQYVYDWLSGDRQNYLEMAARLIENLRDQRSKGEGDTNPDRLVLWFCRRLGFVSYREQSGSVEDEQFAKVLREIADVVSAKADAEAKTSEGGAAVVPVEFRQIAKQAQEAIEQLTAYRDLILQRAREAEAVVPIRRTR
jgi:hypothetical protein